MSSERGESAERGGGGAQWRLRGSPHSGRGDISQFTPGMQERGDVCVHVCDGGGGGLPVPLRVGGTLPLCHRNSSKHFLKAASKKKQHGCTVTQVISLYNCHLH